MSVPGESRRVDIGEFVDNGDNAAFGRAGSVTAPLIGGMVLSGGARNFFLVAAVAPLIAAAGVVVLSRLTRGGLAGASRAESSGR